MVDKTWHMKPTVVGPLNNPHDLGLVSLESDIMNMADEDHAERPRGTKRPRVLVACQRCKTRRQKCDNSSPACSNCHKANVPCIYTNDAYPSSYVKKLEERVRQLEGHLLANKTAIPAQPSSSRDSSQAITGEAMTRTHLASPQSTPPQGTVEEVVRDAKSSRLALGLGVLSSCAAAEPHYFGFSAGLSLAHFVQVAIDSNGNSADISLPLLTDRPFSKRAPKANTSLADPPTFKAGIRYLQAYLNLIHPLYPFLNPQKLYQLHESITKQQRGPAAFPVEKIDMTILHLVYAVGSRCLQLVGKRRISSTVPEGHFLRAMELISQDLKFTSTKSIEVTLLLAIHSMRSPYGTNVWHLAGLAIRQCLELGLHKQRFIDRQNVDVDQYRKRLFWSAYIFERKTALVLGRPFALSDEEIDLDLPANRDERGNSTTADKSHPDISRQKADERTDLSFHRYHVQLYQVHTQIRSALYQMRKAVSKEHLRLTISELLNQLDSWREQVLETFTNPCRESSIPLRKASNSSGDEELVENEESSSSDGGQEEVPLYRPVEVEKNELLLEYYKARRSVLQPLMTESRQNYEFETSDYAACAEASGQVCQLYRRLHRLSPVPFTLRDLHAVFVAGFTLIYCVRTCPAICSVQSVSDVGACSTVLYVVTEQWPSAKKYRDAFETIAEKMMDSSTKFQPSWNRVSGIPNCESQSGSTNQGPRNNFSANSIVARQYESEQGVGGIIHTPASSLEGPMDAYTRTPRPLHPGPTSGPILESSSSPSPMPISPSIPSPSFYPCTESYNDLEQFTTARVEGIGLGVDPDICDIETLLSSEGLDWFTEAVL